MIETQRTLLIIYIIRLESILFVVHYLQEHSIDFIYLLVGICEGLVQSDLGGCTSRQDHNLRAASSTLAAPSSSNELSFMQNQALEAPSGGR